MPMAMMLFEDALRPDVPLMLPPRLRILYLRRGACRLDGSALAEDGAVLCREGATLAGEGELWRFEIAAVPEGWRVPASSRAGLLLARRLARDPDRPFTLRLDRVDFAPDAETPAHGHHGEGIRRLLAGQLLMEIGPLTQRLDAGRAWFETGAEPVVARALLPDTGFIRCMVLDGTMLGRSSFKAWTQEEARKPRNVTYRQYLDIVVRLAPAD
ncbi:MAG TPA: hypothetical protein VD970_06630 [Acetobacteraceae bacterium]|nr:hypothetical protein [Acetobacteraceae bacterium]